MKPFDLNYEKKLDFPKKLFPSFSDFSVYILSKTQWKEGKKTFSISPAHKLIFFMINSI